MKDTYKLGVDLGGTNIRAGLVKNGELIKTSSNKIPQSNDSDFVINTILKTIDQAFIPEVEFIGMGVPGLVDRKNNIIHSIINIPAFESVPMGELLSNKFDRPVKINNDANCFALGEKLFGKGKDYANMVGMALGTGLGVGIITSNKLIEDANCGSGEFGEIPYLNSKIEAYCSGQFFKNQYQSNGEEILEKAKQDYPKAIQAFKEFGFHLSQIVKIICLTIDPEIIVIGGSVAKSNKYFNKALMEGLNDFIYKKSIDELKIEYSDLSNAAILGAASLNN